MNDVLEISDLEFTTRIGVPDDERSTEQKLLITVKLFLDTSAAGANDDINETIDYEEVVNTILELQSNERKIIETLADDISKLIIEKFKPTSVEVTVKKFILPNTKEVRLTIFRKK